MRPVNILLHFIESIRRLPGRLKQELHDLAQALAAGKDISSDESLMKHADWAAELAQKYTFTEENTMDILLQETGKVFAGCLVDAGVFKCDEAGRAAFRAFVQTVNGE